MEQSKEQSNTFADRYQLEEKLGEGGVGVVYRAHDTRLDITVALKTLFPDLGSSHAMRFQQEAKAIAKLNSPNIIRVLDFGKTDDDTPYLVMEYIEGKPLDQLLEEKKFFSSDESIGYMKQICDGLEHAHSNGIIHRDLKPSNLFLCVDENGDKVLKILDFGLAKIVEDQAQTKTGVVMGSAPYVSPEQAEGKKVDHLTDIYSLGCILFEFLTGTHPFTSDNPLSTMLMHSTVEPPLVSEKAEQDVPQHLVEMVSKCLKKAKAYRFQSAQELRSSLDPEESIEEAAEDQIAQEPIESEKPGSKVLLFSLIALAVLIPVAAFMLFNAQKPHQSKKAVKKIPLEFTFEREDEKETWTANPSATDKDFKHFLKVKRIEKLDHLLLENSNISSKGLALLAGKEVKSIDLTKAPNIDDSALIELAKVKNLSKLCLNDTRVSYEGLKQIANLPIKTLHFEFCNNIDDRAIDVIVDQWPDLEKLDVTNTKVTPSGLMKIGVLKRLQSLWSSNVKLTDKNVEVFTHLPLQELTVENSGLDYKALSKLSKIRSLRVLSIRGCPITSKEIAKLKKDIPWCYMYDFTQKKSVDTVDSFSHFLDPQ